MPSKYITAAMLPLVTWLVGTAVITSQYSVSTITVDNNGPVAERPVAKGSPEWLLDKHHCWTANSPAGVIPGHAVVLRSHAMTAEYVGGEQASRALDQVLGGADHFANVYGFCR